MIFDTLSPHPPLLIGLTGRAGAGKDTAAAYLEDQYACHAIGFADPLVDMLGVLCDYVDVDGAWLVERSLKELPMRVLGHSYRELAQTLGTEWGRGLHSDFWVRIAQHQVQQLWHAGSSVVITDLRFPNEAAWVLQMGGTVVRLVRGDAEPVRAHVSEQHTDALPASHELINNGSIATLQDQIDRMMCKLTGWPAQ